MLALRGSSVAFAGGGEAGGGRHHGGGGGDGNGDGDGDCDGGDSDSDSDSDGFGNDDDAPEPADSGHGAHKTKGATSSSASGRSMSSSSGARAPSNSRKRKPCKDCRKVGHESALDKDCEEYVPVDERPQYMTIPVSAPGHTIEKKWLEVLQVAADRASKVIYCMLLFINLHLNHSLQNGAPLAVEVNQDYLQRVKHLFVVSRPTTFVPTDAMREVMRQLEAELLLRGHTFEPVPTIGITPILDDMLVELETNINNFDKFALESHIAKYVRASFNIKRGHASAIANKVMRFGEAGVFITLPATLEGGTLDEWNQRIRELHQRFQVCIRMDDTEGSSYLHGPSVARYRFEMLQEIEEANRQIEAQNAALATPPAGTATPTPRALFRAFTLCPLPSEGRKFIPISNNAMFYLNALADNVATGVRVAAFNAQRLDQCRFSVEDIKNRRNYFRTLDTFFTRLHSNVNVPSSRWKNKDGVYVSETPKVGRRMKHNKGKKKKKNGKKKKKMMIVTKKILVAEENKKWVLADHVVTNGVELHIVFRSKNWPLVGQSERPSKRLVRKFRIKPSDLDPPHLIEDLNANHPVDVPDADFVANLANFTASDPGTKTVMTTCYFDAHAAELKTKSFSADHYRHRAGRLKMLRRVDYDRLTHSIDRIIALYAEHHFKQTNFESLLRAAAVRIANQEVMHAAHSTRAKLKLKFEIRRRAMSANDHVINFLRHNDQVKLIAIGDQGRSFNLPGASQGAPTVKIERRAVKRGLNEGFQVRLINERCTSCKSWCCKGRQMKSIETGHSWRPTPQGDVRARVHGILACQGCGKLWGRDPNAARNIFECAYRALVRQPRPFWLTTSAENVLNVG